MTEPSDLATKQARELAPCGPHPEVCLHDKPGNGLACGTHRGIARALDAAREDGRAEADEHYKTIDGIYQKGRRAGIEEAAKACDDDGSAECEGMARQLRSLSPEPEGEK